VDAVMTAAVVAVIMAVVIDDEMVDLLVLHDSIAK